MSKYSEWILNNAVFYLQLRLQKLGYAINLISFVYDTSVRECHTLTITTDYSHNDMPKFQQANIAFPEEPSHHIIIESAMNKPTKKSPGVVKLIIRRANNIAKLIDYTNTCICEYLNSTDYLNCLALPHYIQPWKVFWPNKEIDNSDPILVSEIKPNLKPSNDVKEAQDEYMHDIKIARENMWVVLTHQEPPDISRSYRLGRLGGILAKGNFLTDNVVLKFEEYSLQFLHEEYLALLSRLKLMPSHKRPKSPLPIVRSAATLITQHDAIVPLVANAAAVESAPAKTSKIIPILPILKPAAAPSSPRFRLFYAFSSDEESDDDSPQKLKKSKPETNKSTQKSLNQDSSTSEATTTPGFRKK
jgi:hypothetical protein